MAPPLNFRFNANEQSGSSYPPSLLKRESAGVDCMQRASFITSSMVWLVRCKTLVPLQLMGWSSAQACSAIADLSVWHLTQEHHKGSFESRNGEGPPLWCLAAEWLPGSLRQSSIAGKQASRTQPRRST